MIRSNRLLALGVVVVVAVSGCPHKSMSDEEYKAAHEAQQKEVIAPLLARYQATVRPVVTGVLAAFADAKKVPPVTQADVSLSSSELPEAADFRYVLVQGDERYTDSNPVARLDLADNKLSELVKILDGSLSSETTTMELEGWLQAYADKRWIAVVRARSYQPPTVSGHTFSPATAEGDAVIYTLPDHKRVGAFRGRSCSSSRRSRSTRARMRSTHSNVASRARPWRTSAGR